MQIKEQTQNHITKFGISIRDHEEAFAKVLTKDKTRSLNKDHVWYTIKKDTTNTIPTPTGPTIDMRGIQRFKLEQEESNEFASIVFHKEGRWSAPSRPATSATLRSTCAAAARSR